MERYRPTDEPLPTHHGGIGPIPVELPEPSTEPDVFIDTFNNQLENALLVDAVSQVRFSEVGPFTVPMPTPGDDVRNREQYTVTVNEQFFRGMRRVEAALYQKVRDHSPMGHEIAQDTLNVWRNVKPEKLMEPGKEVRL